MKKVLVVFGTRPEAIKMCPVIKELNKRNLLEPIVCVTGQHKEMLDQVLEVFNIEPDYDLKIMKKSQTLFDITTKVLEGLKKVLDKEKPDIVLVHGDTTTSFVTSLACFYEQIPVGHVEAGLRTYDVLSPYPEEFNRQAISLTACYHFAPTAAAKKNLIDEKKVKKQIFVTGNTAIDALKTTIDNSYEHPVLDWAKDSRLLLLTAHRRENLGEPLENIFCAVKKIVDEFKNVKVVYPIHFNPEIRKYAQNILGDCKRIKIIEPLNVLEFHNFMAHSYLILTDSGGIQEEAPSLGKPVLVLRNTTERPEGVLAGTLKVIGTEKKDIYKETKELLLSEESYLRMSRASNPYGDGTASKKICDILEKNI